MESTEFTETRRLKKEAESQALYLFSLAFSFDLMPSSEVLSTQVDREMRAKSARRGLLLSDASSVSRCR